MSLLKIGQVKTEQTIMGEAANPYYSFSGTLETTIYNDITSNSKWMTVGQTTYDYLFCRGQVISWTAVNSFSALTTEEKTIAAKHFAVSKEDRDTILSDTDQQDAWGSFVTKSRITRDNRWKEAKSYISYLLPMEDSINMGIKTTELTNNYIVYGIESLTEDGTNGLFDWIENTGMYSGGTGFSGQTYWTQEYQDNLSSLLRNGYKL